MPALHLYETTYPIAPKPLLLNENESLTNFPVIKP